MMSDDLDDWGYKFALATGATPLLARLVRKKKEEVVSIDLLQGNKYGSG